MLNTAKICAFVATTDSEKAKAFYVDTLGLKFVSDDQFAMVLNSNGINVRVTKVAKHTPQQFTVLGWEVVDIKESVSTLTSKGIKFEKYGFPGQDEDGIWTAPMVDNSTGGAKIAWFKDPDGNVLSLAQYR
ncbi:MAG TPA: VOC family protein [Blastocatellia bacterium]|nr:VOC family protein [Blastocatellia bacterium]